MSSSPTPQQAAELRHLAELQAADNAGPKVNQVSLAVDHLLETVAEVAKDMRDDPKAIAIDGLQP